MKEKVYTIFIAPDAIGANSAKEQYKYFQLNGETIEVPIGKFVDVPYWVAKRAKEIGLISDIQIRDKA